VDYNKPRKISETTATQVQRAKEAAAKTARTRKAMQPEPDPDPDRIPTATELQVAYAKRFHKVQTD
jgi:hypothetical protein